MLSTFQLNSAAASLNDSSKTTQAGAPQLMNTAYWSSGIGLPIGTVGPIPCGLTCSLTTFSSAAISTPPELSPSGSASSSVASLPDGSPSASVAVSELLDDE